jgi:hypothetical protein
MPVDHPMAHDLRLTRNYVVVRILDEGLGVSTTSPFFATDHQ